MGEYESNMKYAKSVGTDINKPRKQKDKNLWIDELRKILRYWRERCLLAEDYIHKSDSTAFDKWQNKIDEEP